MTNETYKKAEEIQKELNRWKSLYSITLKPYQKYCLTKKFLWITNCEDTEAIMCDEELTKLVHEYSMKKINKLNKELEAL